MFSKLSCSPCMQSMRNSSLLSQCENQELFSLILTCLNSLRNCSCNISVEQGRLGKEPPNTKFLAQDITAPLHQEQNFFHPQSLVTVSKPTDSQEKIIQCSSNAKYPFKMFHFQYNPFRSSANTQQMGHS